MGILGGCFDPVHFGHLRCAFELMVALSLDEVRFVPCGIPPHRVPPLAPASVREAMVEAAIDGCSRFRLDQRELNRGGASYTVVTLRSLREDFPGIPLCLFLGMDAFSGLAGWHRWEELVRLSHIVVAHRPGCPVPREGDLGALLAGRLTERAADVQESPAGCIYLHPVTQLEISSTAIRAQVAQGGDPRFLVPWAVRQMIVDSGCYRSAPPDAARP